MPALLPADSSPELAHALQHVAVADLCTLQRDAGAAEGDFQPQVGHHGGNDGAAGGPAPRGEGHRADSPDRSEERRVGEECRSRWWADHLKKKKQNEIWRGS